MGRHSAGGGTDVDPIVAAALRQRPTLVAAGSPRHCDEPGQRPLSGSDREGPLGWPGEPHDGTGLGWPADLLTQGATTGDQRAAALVSDETPVRRRLGWRRIFGGGPGTTRGDATSGSTAA